MLYLIPLMSILPDPFVHRAADCTEFSCTCLEGQAQGLATEQNFATRDLVGYNAKKNTSSKQKRSRAYPITKIKTAFQMWAHKKISFADL